jgi:predicted membrane protein
MKRLDYNEPIEEMDEPREENHTKANSAKLTGVFLIAAGALVLTNRIGILPDFLYHMFFNWQTLLVAIGVTMLFNERNKTTGLILITVGGVFLAMRLIPSPFPMKNLFFPALLMAIGLMMILKNKKSKHHFNFTGNIQDYSNNVIHENYIFGGGNVRVISNNFKGGKVTALFGGGQLDLRDAKLSTEKKAVLEVDAIFGGMEIIVPYDWNVVIKSNAIFGGFSNKQNFTNGAQVDLSKEIIIIGNAIFGGGEIKRG